MAAENLTEFIAELTDATTELIRKDPAAATQFGEGLRDMMESAGHQVEQPVDRDQVIQELVNAFIDAYQKDPAGGEWFMDQVNERTGGKLD